MVSAFPCCPDYSFLTLQVNWWTQLVPGRMKHRKICKNSQSRYFLKILFRFYVFRCSFRYNVIFYHPTNVNNFSHFNLITGKHGQTSISKTYLDSRLKQFNRFHFKFYPNLVQLDPATGIYLADYTQLSS